MAVSSLSAVSALLPLPSGRITSSLSSPALAISSVFATQQATLMLTRPSTLDRAQTYQGTLSRVVSFERSARGLLSLSGLNSAFGERQITSDDTSVLTGTAKDLTSARSFGVTVYQVAKAQQTRSDTLAGSDAHGLGNGWEDFRLTRDGVDYDFRLRKNDYSTNLDLLNAVGGEINNEPNIGVAAEVISDATTGNIYLNLTSTTTGTDSAFVLSDIGGDDLLDDLGLLTSQTADVSAGSGGNLVVAQDAQYALDSGGVQTSTSNTIKLFSDSVTLSLAGTSATPVTVKVEPNVSEISSAIQSFVATRDELLTFLNSNTGPGTDQLAYAMKTQAQRVAPDLAMVGVTIGSTGTFTVDTSKLESALTADFDRVVSAFTGAHGLAVQGRSTAVSFLTASSSVITEPANPVARRSVLSQQTSYNMGMLVNLIA